MSYKTIKKTDLNGDIYYGYHDENGNFIYHNDNGPAIIFSNGSKTWYAHSKIHREDGPAVIYADGVKEWYINGKRVSDEVYEWLEERNLGSGKLSEEDQLALSFYMRSL